jgi:NifU-like protein involved in Fe-S cluster formation
VRALFAELPLAGPLPSCDGETAAGEAVALDRGAWVRFEARLDGGRFADCRFRAWGCPHTLAAAAAAASWLRGAAVSDASTIDAARLAREIDAPDAKRGRLLVVEDAIRALIAGRARVE